MISSKTSHMPSEQRWCFTKARTAWWHSVAFDLKVHTQLALSLMVACSLISISTDALELLAEVVPCQEMHGKRRDEVAVRGAQQSCRTWALQRWS